MLHVYTAKAAILETLEVLLGRSSSSFPEATQELFHSVEQIRPGNKPSKNNYLWQDGHVLCTLARSLDFDIREQYIQAQDFFRPGSNELFPLCMPYLSAQAAQDEKAEPSLYIVLEQEADALIVREAGIQKTFRLSCSDLEKSERIYSERRIARALRTIGELLREHGFQEIIPQLQKIQADRILTMQDLAEQNAGAPKEKAELLALLLRSDFHQDIWDWHPMVAEARQLRKTGIPVISAADLRDEQKHKDAHHGHGDDHDHDHDHPSPLERALSYIRLEKKDMTIITIYGVVIGLVSLVTPLTINALVTTISAGLFTLPLVVLSLIIFTGLLIAGGISIAQLYVVEVLQQRLFVNTSFEIAYKFPHAKQSIFKSEYAPELLNRFFDIITLQKGIRKLLVDGLSALIIGVAGLALLVFISPTLLSLGILLILLSIGFVYLLGKNGLKTSVAESKKKYDVAAFLEDVARCVGSFKLIGSSEFIYRKIDDLSSSYVKYRKEHFKVLVRQTIGFTFIRALVNTGVLAVGGYLVIDRQITLGQLVATEIVIVQLITALEKLTSQLEVIYDTLTAFDKVGHITDLALERRDGERMPHRQNGMALRCEHVAFSYDSLPLLKNLNFTIPSGARIALVGKSGAGKSTLAQLLLGVYDPSMGTVLLDEYDVRTLDLASLRKNVGLVFPHDEIFEGTIWENITLGRDWISARDVMEAIRITRLDEAFLRLPKGLQTQVISHGKNLSTGQIRRLMIARAIVHKPRLLILDEAFTGIEEKMKLEILQDLYDPAQKWTILSITHDPEVVAGSSEIYVLSEGSIGETGSPRSLACNPDSLFRTIFPDLTFVLNSELFITQNRDEK